MLRGEEKERPGRQTGGGEVRVQGLQKNKIVGNKKKKLYFSRRCLREVFTFTENFHLCREGETSDQVSVDTSENFVFLVNVHVFVCV